MRPELMVIQAESAHAALAPNVPSGVVGSKNSLRNSYKITNSVFSFSTDKSTSNVTRCLVHRMLMVFK